MTFEVEVEGRAHTVSVDRVAPGRYRVVVDTRAHMIDAVRVGHFSLSLLAGGTNTSREVQVAPGPARGELLIGLEGRTVAVAVNGRRRKRGGERVTEASGEQAVLAPMPGRVLRVLVNAGDNVTARQPLLVVEAMKMENELRSPKAGRVKEVAVKAGTSVEAGRVLVVIE